MRPFLTLKPLAALVLSVGVASVAIVGVAYAQQDQESPPSASAAGEYKPLPPPEQPIPYSHKTHLALGLTCVNCHQTVETAERASFPPTSTCMGCHASVKADSPSIQKLKDYDDKKQQVPWRRVYREPSFVYFSHKTHVTDAKVTCDNCHGNVAGMEQMQKVKDTSMATCIECHKARSAPVACDSCHEPQ